MRSSMSGQSQITSYFKPAGQSDSTSTNSRKSSLFTSCLCSAPRLCPSANRIAGTSQHQHIATDGASSLGTQQKLKSDVFTSSPSSAPRACSPANQVARTPRIATDEAPDLEIQQKTKNCSSSRPSGQEYIAVADVDHTNKGIRVGTPLTNAREYNSIKSSVKLFKSPKSSRKLKSSISSSRPSSAPRACFLANQDARTPHIALDKTLSPTSCRPSKSFKSAVFISSPSSTLRSSRPANHNSVMPQMLTSMPSRTDLLRALINQQVAYAPKARSSAALRQRYLAPPTPPHRHLGIRVGTTLRGRKEIV